jgi:hypothetical protein
MLSNRAMTLAVSLAVLSHKVDGAEGSARCVDASAPRHPPKRHANGSN